MLVRPLVEDKHPAQGCNAFIRNNSIVARVEVMDVLERGDPSQCETRRRQLSHILRTEYDRAEYFSS